METVYTWQISSGKSHYSLNPWFYRFDKFTGSEFQSILQSDITLYLSYSIWGQLPAQSASNTKIDGVPIETIQTATKIGILPIAPPIYNGEKAAFANFGAIVDPFGLFPGVYIATVTIVVDIDSDGVPPFIEFDFGDTIFEVLPK